MIRTIKQLFRGKPDPGTEKPVEEAYDTWSGSYDAQPDNLMLQLDELIFSTLFKNINIKDRRLVDIGCGTGRHWQKMYDAGPASLLGYDVSAGMLVQLKKKFPDAVVFHTADNLLSDLSAGSTDCIVSTLTVAHIKNIEEAIVSWSRILAGGGDIIITDFHPAILEKGGRRSFKHAGESLSVKNYVHPPEQIIHIFNKHGFELIAQEERYIDEKLRHYYEMQNALSVYERFEGNPVIYGLHLKKQYVTA
jgi:ubiquinone/menaquinone biosynthesis C-methylase UbiE